MSIWVVVIFVILTLVGLVMVGIGLHEKTKHKNDTPPPGKTYDILLYVGIGVAVIGLIGAVWSGISYAKSKKAVVVQGPPQGQFAPPPYGPPQGPYGSPDFGGSEYGIEMTSMSQGPPSPPQGPQFVPLPDGRIYNVTTGAVIPSAGSMMQSSSPFGMMQGPSQASCAANNTLNLEEFMKAAKLLQELKMIING